MANNHTQFKYVDARELADYLCVRAATIRRWANVGRIPSVRLSTKVLRFKLEEVEDALRGRETKDAHR